MSMTTENAPSKKRLVFDIHDHPYELIEQIGKGGQGVVWTTNFNNILVKIINRDVAEEKRNRWWFQIQRLMRLPLDGLPIAHPVALITKPRAGYVMELMNGLEPLSNLMQKTNDEGVEGYLKTGGLQRRLKLLEKLAKILAELHGRGLAYGDISPANIFISQSIEYSEVWLIDADNIDSLSRDVHYAITDEQPEYKNQFIYTPDYGAPEILRGESGITTLTDSWSFAVLAFYLLTIAHPLKGDLVLNETPEMEEAALRGELPWVDHPTDSSNTRSIGFPSDMVLEKPLRRLFEKCFGPGMNDGGVRPSLNEWAEAFEMASKHCVQCQLCKSSFVYSSKHTCPFCDQIQDKQQTLLLQEYYYIPVDFLRQELGESIPESLIQKECWSRTGKVLVLNSKPIELKTISCDGNAYKNATLLCKLELKADGLWIEPSSDTPVLIHSSDNKNISITRKQKLNSESRSNISFWLHIGSIDSEHFVWKFIW
jgi:serine/threonine protein kinase